MRKNNSKNGGKCEQRLHNSGGKKKKSPGDADNQRACEGVFRQKNSAPQHCGGAGELCRAILKPMRARGEADGANCQQNRHPPRMPAVPAGDRQSGEKQPQSDQQGGGDAGGFVDGQKRQGLGGKRAQPGQQGGIFQKGPPEQLGDQNHAVFGQIRDNRDEAGFLRFPRVAPEQSGQEPCGANKGEKQRLAGGEVANAPGAPGGGRVRKEIVAEEVHAVPRGREITRRGLCRTCG